MSKTNLTGKAIYHCWRIKVRTAAEIVELAEGAAPVGPTADPLPIAKGLPPTWDEIAPGHLVIAQESLAWGWWEAVVIARTGDLLTLRYRDYPKIPKFFRHRSAIALMASPAAS